MKIRAATIKDLARIFEIRTGVKENHLSMIQLEELGITPQAVSMLIEQSDAVWVVEIANQVEGFAMVDLQEACVFAAFVRDECMGQGLGQALMQRAESILFKKHSVIWLETAKSSRAFTFYQRQGWQQVGDVVHGDVRMEKRRFA